VTDGSMHELPWENKRINEGRCRMRSFSMPGEALSLPSRFHWSATWMLNVYMQAKQNHNHLLEDYGDRYPAEIANVQAQVVSAICLCGNGKGNQGYAGEVRPPSRPMMLTERKCRLRASQMENGHRFPPTARRFCCSDTRDTVFPGITTNWEDFRNPSL
jgi:hypothetical protein